MMSEELEGIFDPESLVDSKDHIALFWGSREFRCHFVSYSIADGTIDLKLRFVDALGTEMIGSSFESFYLLIPGKRIEVSRDRLTKVTFKPMSVRLKFRE